MATFDDWLKQQGYSEGVRTSADVDPYYVKAGESGFKRPRYDPRDLEQQYRTPIDTAARTKAWTDFFAGGGFGGGLAGMTPQRQAELVAAALAANPVQYGMSGQQSEGQEWGLMPGGDPLPKNVFSLLNPQEYQQQMQKLQEMERARGPDIGGKLVLGAILASMGYAGLGAGGFLGPGAETLAGAAGIGGGGGGGAAAGNALGAGLDYSMTGALSGPGSVGGGLGTGLGTATGASAGANAALSAANPFSLATAAGAGGGLASGAGTLSNAISPFSLGTPGATPPIGGGGTQPTAGNSTAVGRVVDQLMGKGEASTSDWASILGTAGATGLGLLGANAQTDALKDIYSQTRADRSGALNAFNSALRNPNSFYQTQPAIGAVEGVLSKLSVLGNPANNPSSLAKAAAYNLGGYNDYLRSLSGPAFGTASTEANLGSQAAGAEGGAYNALGFGLSSLLNPQPTIQDLLKLIRPNLGGTSAA